MCENLQPWDSTRVTLLCLSGISSSLPLWCSNSQVLNTCILRPHGLRTGCCCYYSNLRTGIESLKNTGNCRCFLGSLSALIRNILRLTQNKGTLLTQTPLPITAAPSLEELEKCNNTVSRTGHIQNRRKTLISYCRTS